MSGKRELAHEEALAAKLAEAEEEEVEDETTLEPEIEAEEVRDDKVSEVVVIETDVSMTIDDAVERLKGLARTAKTRGITAITKRIFDGLDGFLGGDEKKRE